MEVMATKNTGKASSGNTHEWTAIVHVLHKDVHVS